MRMLEKCRNKNNSDNPLISRRTDGGKYRDKYTGLFLTLTTRWQEDLTFSLGTNGTAWGLL